MAEKYVDENGDPIPESELHRYAIDESAPKAVPADRPAPSQRSGARRGLAMVAAIAVLAGGGYVALDRGWVKPTSTPAAASSSAAPETTTGTTAAPTTTGAATTTTATAAPTTTAEPVPVTNERYTGARWSSTSVKAPSLRLRVTAEVTLPKSFRDLGDDNAAKAFDRFRPWYTIVATGADQLTVQGVSKSRPGKPWSEATVSTKDGKLQVVGEKGTDNVDDSEDLVDVAGAHEADSEGGTYRVESEGFTVPEAARGKRKNAVLVSALKRDAKDSSVVWIVAGDKLLRTTLEDASAGAAAPGEDVGETETKGEK